MDRGLLQNFSSSVSLFTKLMSFVHDDFVNSQMSISLSRFLEAYVGLLLSYKSSDRQDLFAVQLNMRIDSILDLLSLAGHLEIARQENVLPTKVAFYNLKREVLVFCVAPKNTQPKSQEVQSPIAPPLLPKKSRRTGEIKLGPNQEKIFNFIKEAGDSRTKEIIAEFPILSDRTIKRSLKDLVRQGIVKKRSENKAVFYSVSKTN